jgi:hypothetical protein
VISFDRVFLFAGLEQASPLTFFLKQRPTTLTAATNGSGRIGCRQPAAGFLCTIQKPKLLQEDNKGCQSDNYETMPLRRCSGSAKSSSASYIRGQIYDYALAEAQRYAEAGVDGLIVENHGDIPFLKPDAIGPETAACMAVMTERVRVATGLQFHTCQPVVERLRRQ